jgi:hypothetical protein
VAELEKVAWCRYGVIRVESFDNGFEASVTRMTVRARGSSRLEDFLPITEIIQTPIEALLPRCRELAFHSLVEAAHTGLAFA